MRPIDAEAFQKFIEKQDESADYTIYHFEEWLEQQPTIEAKPVVHARWVTDFDFDPEEEQERYFYFCSKCKNELFGNKEDFKYCPYCGAQMDEEVSG